MKDLCCFFIEMNKLKISEHIFQFLRFFSLYKFSWRIYKDLCYFLLVVQSKDIYRSYQILHAHEFKWGTLGYTYHKVISPQIGIMSPMPHFSGTWSSCCCGQLIKVEGRRNFFEGDLRIFFLGRDLIFKWVAATPEVTMMLKYMVIWALQDFQFFM